MSSFALADTVMTKAEEAFNEYRKINAAEKASFLKTIAALIELQSEQLIQVANEETNLPEPRLKNEIGRTINQLNSFASLLEEGDWVQATLDIGDPDRKPLAKPDIRKMASPLGPVVIFGASNFPFAFSTAGGDTASALAAGCPVVVKSHPAHPKTSALVAEAIEKAIKDKGFPKHVFQHIEDTSIEMGAELVKHPLTKAASFTGSYKGGKALFDLAGKRPEPIPFFAEMGSVNPVVVLPQAIRKNENLSTVLAASVTLGVGQFCTNPGLIIVMDDQNLPLFLDKLSDKISNTIPSKMLHRGISENYHQRKKTSLQQDGVVLLAEVSVAEEEAGSAALGLVTADCFFENDFLKEEVFGPYSLVVKCINKEEVIKVVKSLPGQLTATVFGEADEVMNYRDVIEALQQKCGRLIFNGVPTGVEVCKGMHHGGPFPSTTDSRFTSVGVDAIYRFVRPVAYQDFPDILLPEELRNLNLSDILRCVNGKWTRSSI